MNNDIVRMKMTSSRVRKSVGVRWDVIPMRPCAEHIRFERSSIWFEPNEQYPSPIMSLRVGFDFWKILWKRRDKRKKSKGESWRSGKPKEKLKGVDFYMIFLHLFLVCILFYWLYVDLDWLEGCVKLWLFVNVSLCMWYWLYLKSCGCVGFEIYISRVVIWKYYWFCWLLWWRKKLEKMS